MPTGGAPGAFWADAGLRPADQEDRSMIGLTRGDGEHCRLNPDHIQRVEGHPATVVYLTDGAKYAVAESVDDVVRAVRDHHAAVKATAYRLITGPDAGVVEHSAPAPGRRPVAPVTGEA
jgi:flagellar protein FlbD